jgi:YbbR domain-containing protein
MPPLKRIFANNMSLKISAILVALLLWAFAKGEQTASRTFTVPLLLRNVPEGVSPRGRVPDTIDVVLTGDNKDLLKLGLWGDPFAFADMKGAKAGGVLTISLSAANVVLPHDVEGVDAEIHHPASLQFDIDDVMEKMVRVVPDTVGALAPEYFPLGRPVSIPEAVKVIGPAAIVDTMETVRTASLSVSGRRSRVEASRRVIFPEEWNLHAVPKEVRVVVEVEGTEIVTMRGIPLALELEPGRLSTRLEPDAVTIRVKGPEHLVTRLSSAEVIARAAARAYPRGEHQIRPTVQVPDGMEVLDIDPEEVTVFIE